MVLKSRSIIKAINLNIILIIHTKVLLKMITQAWTSTTTRTTCTTAATTKIRWLHTVVLIVVQAWTSVVVHSWLFTGVHLSGHLFNNSYSITWSIPLWMVIIDHHRYECFLNDSSLGCSIAIIDHYEYIFNIRFLSTLLSPLLGK